MNAWIQAHPWITGIAFWALAAASILGLILGGGARNWCEELHDRDDELEAMKERQAA